jgi:hypothetical protein
MVERALLLFVLGGAVVGCQEAAKVPKAFLQRAQEASIRAHREGIEPIQPHWFIATPADASAGGILDASTVSSAAPGVPFPNGWRYNFGIVARAPQDVSARPDALL